jgi:hypothetical protein
MVQNRLNSLGKTQKIPSLREGIFWKSGPGIVFGTGVRLAFGVHLERL